MKLNTFWARLGDKPFSCPVSHVLLSRQAKGREGRLVRSDVRKWGVLWVFWALIGPKKWGVPPGRVLPKRLYRRVANTRLFASFRVQKQVNFALFGAFRVVFRRFGPKFMRVFLPFIEL